MTLIKICKSLLAIPHNDGQVSLELAPGKIVDHQNPECMIRFGIPAEFANGDPTHGMKSRKCVPHEGMSLYMSV